MPIGCFLLFLYLLTLKNLSEKKMDTYPLNQCGATCRLQPRDEFKKYNLYHIHNQSSKLNASDYVEDEGENNVNDVMMR